MSVVERTIRKLQEEKQAAGDANAAQAAPQSVAQTALAPQAPAMPPAPVAPRTRSAPIVLDRGVLRGAGLLPPEPDMKALARQYRNIKHPLVAQAVGRGGPRVPKGHLIMIASAMSGEGKSFTAVNLALSLALEKDINVLLVDADVAKPQLSHVFGVGHSRGLLDALRDPALDVESLIRPTDVPNLSFLPAGEGAEEATELLSSSRMEQIARYLGENDPLRVVLFDSPPLLQTTESVALARVAGQIVVVVRAEWTPQPVLLDALKVLDGHPAVSLVLNQSQHSAAASYYYYYGYGKERPDAGQS
jgi:exopolysaccharide/PEP-CTERM locus tyrosine autokinase